MNLLSSSRTYLPDGTSERVFLGALSLLLLGIGCGLPADETAGPTASQPLEAAASQIDDGVPRARLLLPSFSTGPLPTVGPRMYCRWDAFDQSGDLQNATQAPSGFEYKLVEILPTYTDEDVEYEFFYADNLLLEDGNDPTAWIPVGPDVRALTVEFPSLGYRAFAVRAVDAMGQGEEVLERHRNYESFLVTSDFPNPELTVLRPSGYHYRFEESDDVWTTSVVPGVDFDLSWLVDASHYGAPPGQTKYAFDIADPEDDAISSPNGIGGWTDWARRDGIASPIRFGVEEAGTEHVLYVRARDGFEDSDFEILATIRIQVAPITFDRFALIVDDTKSVGTDDEHDAYVDEVLAARLREIGSVDYFDVYGDPEGYSPHPIPLELLGRYQVVLWHTNRNLNPRSGLELSQNALGAYMSAGGRVFLIGGRLAGLALDDFSYPKEFSMEYDWRGTFVWDRLHYEDTIVGVPTSGSSMLQEASGIIGCTSLRPGFPSLVLDESKWDPMVEDGGQYRGGIRHWEGVLAEEPLQYPVEGFEPLYAPDTFDLSFCCGPVAPRYEDAMIAHRYESPFGLGDWRYQGRTVVFDFQPWYFESDGVSEACRNAVDWLVDGLAAPGRGSVGHLSSAGGARLRLR